MKDLKFLIGTDLVFLPRFIKSLQNKRFIPSIFHETEIAYCESRGVQRVASYAARFAAKEAFAKALGTGIKTAELSFLDVWIARETGGKPTLQFTADLQHKLKNRRIQGWDVSLAHHGDYATAYVMLWALETPPALENESNGCLG